MFWPFSDEFSLLCRYVFELISMQSVLLILYVMKQYCISPSNSTLFLHSQIEHTILKIKRFFQLVSKICFYVFLDRFAFLDWDRVSLRSKYLVIASCILCCAWLRCLFHKGCSFPYNIANQNLKYEKCAHKTRRQCSYNNHLPALTSFQFLLKWLWW